MATSAVDRFREQAEAAGMDVEVRSFPEGTRTAADAAAAIGCEVGQIVKSLVFVAEEGRAVLALTSGANRVDETRLAEAVGADRVRKADADEARQATGYSIGGTPPFGHDALLAVVCDRDLAAFDEVWAAAGSPQHVFAIDPADLVRVAGARVVDLAG